MSFKLIRIQSDDPYKINLKTGTHDFGRGKLFHVADKRISRNHGQIKVTEDSLMLTALHQNPCFYIKGGTSETQVLRKDDSVTLNNGDRLGLLPDSYWFEVVQNLVDSENDDQDQYQEKKSTQSADSGEETDNEAETVLTAKHSIEEIAENQSQSTQVLSQSQFNIEQNANHMDVDTDNESQNTVVPEVCNESNGANDSGQGLGSPSLLTSNQAADSNQEELGEAEPSAEPSEASLKRSHSVTENDDVKKIKTEQDEKPDVKPDLAGASSSNAVDGPKPAVPLRERCMYGANCYRRNPAHLAQYSHPADADWGAGERAPCPWGAACGKRDPRHYRDHDHPPGKGPPPPQPGMRVVHRQGNVFYINARAVNFYDDHFEADDSDGNSVDYDYEF